MRSRGMFDHGALPDDARVSRIVAREGLSVLDDVEVEVMSRDPHVELEEMLGTRGAVGVAHEGDDEPRLFHGVVDEAAFVGTRQGACRYRFRLRPALHLLARRVRSRVFQSLTVPDVVSSVLEGAGIGAATVSRVLDEDYPRREYTVQWKESELAFVCRLLESEGIFFRFEHGATDCVLELRDSMRGAVPIDGDPVLVLADRTSEHEQTVRDLTFTQRVCPDRYLARDWSFERPEMPRQGEASRANDGGLLVYEYPGGFADDARGDALAARRLQELLTHERVLRGITPRRRLAPGRLVTVVGCEDEPWIEGEHLVTKVEHRFHDHGLRGGSSEPRYEARFEAIPRETPFRAPRTTPRPRIAGRETAVVTGPPGEEIHVDAYGRVRVRFYWDREGPSDDGSSCWLRVQQLNTSGSMFLPRVGWEVEVGFLDGDPDRPVVLSRAYEADSLPPYGLPASKTRNALQTASSPGGGGTHEIRTEDANGAMELFVHASRDHSVNVGHDCREDVKVAASDSVGLTLTANVALTETVVVGGDQCINVTGQRIDETGGDRNEAIGPLDDWGVKGNLQMKNDGMRTETVGSTLLALANQVAETFNADYRRDVTGMQGYATPSSIVESVAGTKRELVGGAKLEVIRGAKGETIGEAKALTSGALKISTGADVTYAAEGALTLRAGSIEEDVGGVWSLAAKSVHIDASGRALLRAGGVSFTVESGKLASKGGKMGVAANSVRLKAKKIRWK